MPTTQTLISGGAIFNCIHAFFGDHKEIAAWVDLVERAKAVKPKTVVALHSKTLSPSGEIVALQLAWLIEPEKAMKTNDNWQYVKIVMTKKYPNWGDDFIFEFYYSVRK